MQLQNQQSLNETTATLSAFSSERCEKVSEGLLPEVLQAWYHQHNHDPPCGGFGAAKDFELANVPTRQNKLKGGDLGGP